MGDSRCICEFCLNTDFALALDPSRWNASEQDDKARDLLGDAVKVMHQPGIASLRASALQGCPICLFFMEVLQLPLRLQDPEFWGRFEERKSKQIKKAAKRAFDAARENEDEGSPCFITALRVHDICRSHAPPNGAVSGFSHGCRHSSIEVRATSSDSSLDGIATRNLLNHLDIGICRELPRRIIHV